MQPCLIGGHNDGIVNGVNHPRFKSDLTTNGDGMLKNRGISVMLKVPRDSVIPKRG